MSRRFHWRTPQSAAVSLLPSDGGGWCHRDPELLLVWQEVESFLDSRKSAMLDIDFDEATAVSVKPTVSATSSSPLGSPARSLCQSIRQDVALQFALGPFGLHDLSRPLGSAIQSLEDILSVQGLPKLVVAVAPCSSSNGTFSSLTVALALAEPSSIRSTPIVEHVAKLIGMRSGVRGGTTEVISEHHYSMFFEKVSMLFGSDDESSESIGVAGRLCLVAKGMCLLAEAKNIREGRPVRSLVGQAASALGISGAALEAKWSEWLAEPAEAPDSLTTFMEWIALCWLKAVLRAINRSLFYLSFAQRHAAARSLAQPHLRFIRFGYSRSVDTLQRSDEINDARAQAMSSYELLLAGNMQRRDAWFDWASMWRCSELADDSIDGSEDVLSIVRLPSSTLQHLDAHRTLLVTVAPPPGPPVNSVADPMLVTCCQFVRLVTRALPNLFSSTMNDGAIKLVVDDDEADDAANVRGKVLSAIYPRIFPLPLVLRRDEERPHSVASCVASVAERYKQCTLVNQARLLCVALDLRVVEYFDPEDEAKEIEKEQFHIVSAPLSGGHQQLALFDVTLCIATGLVKVYNTALLAKFERAGAAAVCHQHVPLVQSFLRCVDAMLRHTRPKKHRVVLQAVSVIQIFLRWRKSMKEVTRRETYEAAMMFRTHNDYCREAPAAAVHSSTPPTTPLRIVSLGEDLSKRRAIFAEHCERTEHRYRTLIVQEEESIRSQQVLSLFAHLFPVSMVMWEEAGERHRIADEWRQRLMGITMHRESTLRDRVHSLEARGRNLLLGKTASVRQLQLIHLEEVMRGRIVRLYERCYEEWVANIHLLNHMEALADLKGPDNVASRHNSTNGVDDDERHPLPPLTPFQRTNPFTAPTEIPLDRNMSKSTAAFDGGRDVPPVFLRQREKFVKNVLLSLTSIINNERDARRELYENLRTDELKSREHVARGSLQRQAAFHWSRLALLEQRNRLTAMERQDRVLKFLLDSCEAEEMCVRYLHVMIHQLDQREVMYSLEELERRQREQNARVWRSVCSDRYTSPQRILESLMQEQQMVRRLLATVSQNESRIENQRRGAKSPRTPGRGVDAAVHKNASQNHRVSAAPPPRWRQ